MIVSIFTFETFAQENTKQKEAGITFRGLSNFGLTYRIGTESSLWRFNVLSVRSNLQTTEDLLVTRTDFNIGGALKIGKEFRKPIADKFNLRYGLDASFSYYFNKSENKGLTPIPPSNQTVQHNYSPGINLVFGINYNITNNLILGAEILPELTYRITQSKTSSTNNNNTLTTTRNQSDMVIGFSNQNALISVVYRF